MCQKRHLILRTHLPGKCGRDGPLSAGSASFPFFRAEFLLGTDCFSRDHILQAPLVAAIALGPDQWHVNGSKLLHTKLGP